MTKDGDKRSPRALKKEKGTAKEVEGAGRDLKVCFISPLAQLDIKEGLGLCVFKAFFLPSLLALSLFCSLRWLRCCEGRLHALPFKQ